MTGGRRQFASAEHVRAYLMRRALHVEGRAVLAGMLAYGLRGCAAVALGLTAVLGVIHADRPFGPVEAATALAAAGAYVLAVPARKLEERWEIRAYRYRLAASVHAYHHGLT